MPRLDRGQAALLQLLGAKVRRQIQAPSADLFGTVDAEQSRNKRVANV